MSRPAPPLTPPPDRTFPDRLFIAVPWKQAQRLRNRLREHFGLVATACFLPEERMAGLEFRPGTDRDAVLEALRELGS